MAENLTCILLRSQGRQCGNDRQRNGRNGDELEQTGIYLSDKVKKFIKRAVAHPAKSGTNGQGQNPDDELTLVMSRPAGL